MQYRFAKNLLEGDEVIRKSDKKHFKIIFIQAFGQYKKALLNCVDDNNINISMYNDEVE